MSDKRLPDKPLPDIPIPDIRNDSFNPEDTEDLKKGNAKPVPPQATEHRKANASTELSEPRSPRDKVPAFSFPATASMPSEGYASASSQAPDITAPSAADRPESSHSSSTWSYRETGIADTMTIQRARPQEVLHTRKVSDGKSSSHKTDRLSVSYGWLDAPSLFDTPPDSGAGSMRGVSMGSGDRDVNTDSGDRNVDMDRSNDPALFSTPSDASRWNPLFNSSSQRVSTEVDGSNRGQPASHESTDRSLTVAGSIPQEHGPGIPGLLEEPQQPRSRTPELVSDSGPLSPEQRREAMLAGERLQRTVQAGVDATMAERNFWSPQPGFSAQRTGLLLQEPTSIPHDWEPANPTPGPLLQASNPEGSPTIEQTHGASWPLTQENIRRVEMQGIHRPWATRHHGSQESSTLLSTNFDMFRPTSMDIARDYTPLLRDDSDNPDYPIRQSIEPADPNYPNHRNRTSTVSPLGARSRGSGDTRRGRNRSNAISSDQAPSSRASLSSSFGQKLKTKMKSVRGRGSSLLQSLRSSGSSQRSLLQAATPRRTLPEPHRLEQQQSGSTSPHNYSYLFSRPSIPQRPYTTRPPGYFAPLYTDTANTHPYTHHPMNPSINTINTGNPAPAVAPGHPRNPFNSLRRISRAIRPATPPRRANNSDQSENQNNEEEDDDMNLYHAMHVSMPDFSQAFPPDLSHAFIRKYINNNHQDLAHRGYMPLDPPFPGWLSEKTCPWDATGCPNEDREATPPIPPRHPLHTHPKSRLEVREKEEFPPKYSAASLPCAAYAFESPPPAFASASASTSFPSGAYTTAPTSAPTSAPISAAIATSQPSGPASLAPSAARAAESWVDQLVSSPIDAVSDSTSSSSSDYDDDDGCGDGGQGGDGYGKRGKARVCSRLLDQLPLNGDVQIAIALDRAAGRRGGWWQPRVR